MLTPISDTYSIVNVHTARVITVGTFEEIRERLHRFPGTGWQNLPRKAIPEKHYHDTRAGREITRKQPPVVDVWFFQTGHVWVGLATEEQINRFIRRQMETIYDGTEDRQAWNGSNGSAPSDTGL